MGSRTGLHPIFADLPKAIVSDIASFMAGKYPYMHDCDAYVLANCVDDEELADYAAARFLEGEGNLADAITTIDRRPMALSAIRAAFGVAPVPPAVARSVVAILDKAAHDASHSRAV